jgi:hypothetical protein
MHGCCRVCALGASLQSTRTLCLSLYAGFCSFCLYVSGGLVLLRMYVSGGLVKGCETLSWPVGRHKRAGCPWVLGVYTCGEEAGRAFLI